MTLPGRYILDESNEKPVRCDDLLTWAKWFEGVDRRRVARTALADGKILVSTVFLSLDHNFAPDGPPVLWETMVFRAKENGEIGGSLECERCSGNREQALAMHETVCARAEALLNLGLVLEHDSHE